MLKRDIDHTDQPVVLERLLEEIYRTELHGLDSQRNIAVAGHDHDRQSAAARFQSLQHLNSVDAGHADVGDYASKVDAGEGAEKMLGGLEQRDAKVSGAE